MPADRPLAVGGALRRPFALVMVIALAGCSAAGRSVSPSAELTSAASRTPFTVAPSVSATVDICGQTDPATPSDGVLVYFTCGTSPVAPPIPVVRASGSSAEELLTEALMQLLAGPTTEEQERGWRSWFSAATADMLLSAAVTEDGLAVVDFADFRRLIPNASTSAGRRQLLGELQSTVFQFQEVSRLELRFDGDCLSFWSWLGSLRCELLERPPE